MDSEERHYSLFQRDIIPKLEQRPFFLKAITLYYKKIAAEFGADVTISVRRLADAYSYWQDDVRRIILHGMPAGTKELDSYKHASHIAFWLRRTIPVEQIISTWDQQTDTPKDGFHKGLEFYKHGNEICAILVGYYICLNYHTQSEINKIDTSQRLSKDRVLDLVKGKRLEILRSIKLPSSLLDEYTRILKHKNISPYALYMMYKSIFSNLLI